LRLADYKRMLQSGGLDYVAITDHNRIDFAQAAQAELGDSIIIGEEIMTLKANWSVCFCKPPSRPA